MIATTASTTEEHNGLTAAILSAVFSIVAREGFEGATIRRVAAEAGCSAGAVQKRFATRVDLLRAGFQLMVSESVERIRAGDSRRGHLCTNTSGGEKEAEEEEQDNLIARHRVAALEALPLDDLRRREALVWTAYVLRAATDAELSDLPQRLDTEVHDHLVSDLAEARQAGIVATDTDLDALADALTALIDGLAIRMLYTPTTEHPALLAALDVGLNALLPHRGG